MTSPAPISHPSPGLLLTSPDTVLSAVPFLLGFTPTDSAVIVWLRDGCLVLTQRVDLPAVADEDAWMDVVFGHAAVSMCNEVIAIAYADGDAATALLHQIRARAEFGDLHVLDAIVTDGERWRSLLHTDCCGDSGHPIDGSARAAIGAEFAVRGVAPSASRDDLVRELTVDLDGRATTTGLLDVSAADRASILVDDRDNLRREQWRDELINACRLALRVDTDADVDPHESAADLIEGMADVRVRDTLLWECSGMRDHDLRAAREALAAAVTVAPPGRVAPVATCAAIFAWLLGDGARASIALERAYQDDPDYSLMRLIDAAVQGGLPPDAWRASLQQLTWEDCRHGFRPQPPKRKAPSRKKRRKRKS